MKKINFEKLKNEKKAVYFETKEDMIDFLKECDKQEIKWLSRDKASSKDYFDSYKNFAIKLNSYGLGYADAKHYEEDGCQIINYKEFINSTEFGEITKIITNGEATIVFWNDDTKTIVKRGKGQKNSQELAILYAYFQKHSGLSKTKANKAIQDLISNIYVQG